LRILLIKNKKSKINVYLARRANLEDCRGSMMGICEFPSNKELDVHGLQDFTSSGDLRRISDNETVVASFFGAFLGDITCDRSRIILKRGETACCNPLKIFKSSVGTSLYINSVLY
jgi:hypothetical protein